MGSLQQARHQERYSGTAFKEKKVYFPSKLLEAQEHDMTTKEDYECWAAGKELAAEARGESKGEANAISVFEKLGASPEMIAQAKAMLAAEASNTSK